MKAINFKPFLASLMSLLISVSIKAEIFSGPCGSDVNWTYDTSTYELIISGNGPMISCGKGNQSSALYNDWKNKIRKVIINEGVTSICEYAFANCTSLTSITIPSSVSVIESGAFYYCKMLTEISLPEGITSIGSSAFSCSGLQTMTLPNSIKRVENALFSDCVALTEINLPDGLKSIGESAFRNCTALTSLTIPQSVVEIGKWAFSDCVGEVTIKCNLPDYQAQNESPFNGSKYTTIKIESKNIGSFAFFGCSSTTSFILSEGLLSIGKYAFYGCTNMTSLNLPQSVESLSNRAFENCNTNLTTPIYNEKFFVALPKSYSGSFDVPSPIHTICYGAFKGCTGLTSVNLPNTLKTIETQAFSGCSGFVSISLPEGLKHIGNRAFSYCTGLTSVSLPESVEEVESSVFSGCSNLESPIFNSRLFVKLPQSYTGSFTIPNSIKIICSKAFDECRNLTSLIIPESVTNVGFPSDVDVADVGIGYCPGLTTPVYNSSIFVLFPRNYSGAYTIPAGIQEIGDYAFDECKGLTSVTIPTSVNTIGEYVFRFCSGLTSVNIPSSVNKIGAGTFYGCTSLVKATLPNGITTIENSLFVDAALTSISIPSSVTGVEDRAFSGCDNLTSVNLPESVETVGASAFSRCSALKIIILPNSLTRIGRYAFSGCSALTSLTLPSSLQEIGQSAFEDCTGELTIKCDLPDYSSSSSPFNYSKFSKIIIDSDRVGDYAFYTSFTESEVTSFVLTDKLRSVGNQAFGGRKGVLSVPSSITEYGNAAFSNCTGISSVAIPEGTQSIGNETFANCTGIISLSLPQSLKKIGTGAFSQCSSLKSVIIPGSVEYISYCAFYACKELTDLTISEGVKVIGSNAFYGCEKIKSIRLPEGIVAVGSYAFFHGYAGSDNNSPMVIEFPNSLTYIGSRAFMGSSLKHYTIYASTLSSWCNISFVDYFSNPLCSSESLRDNCEFYIDGSEMSNIVIPDDVKTIKANTFYGDYHLKSVTIHDGVTSIGEHAFSLCKSLTSVSIPGSVTTIGIGAFTLCSALSSITIPADVRSIGEYAFHDCSNLNSVTVKMQTPVSISSNTFSNRTNAILYVPYGCKPAYETADFWKEFKEIVEMPKVTSSLAISDASGLVGCIFTLPINMTNEDEITAMQFELSLPEGVSLTSAALTDRKNDHTIGYKQAANGNYQFTVFSGSSKAFSGNEGVVANISLSISNSMAAGNYTIQMKNIELTTTAATAINPADQSASLNVSNIKLADVNGDDKISITDAVGIVNYILGNASSNFHAEAADVNGDNKISITDAVAVVNIILNQGSGVKERRTQEVENEREPQ